MKFSRAKKSLRLPLRLCVSAAILTLSANSQSTSPWESVAPSGASIYTDMKSALKEPAMCYRLDLTNADFTLDRKILPKVPQLTSVMALKLGNNNLTQIPSVFLSLPALAYFGSFNNPLTTISDSIGMLGALRYIELTGTNFDTLPSALEGLERLQSLSISRNKDTLHIPKDFSSLHNSLTDFSVYYTVLDTLPTEFAKLDKVKRLVFYKCGFNYFPRQIMPMASLQELYLDSNRIRHLPRDISSMTNLKVLSLKGNMLMHIPSTICFLKNLEVLDLTGNPIDPYEVKVVQALLPQCRILF